MNKQYWLFGSKVAILADADQTESNFDLVEGIFPPGSRSPLHLHTKYSETFYVLEGEALIITPGKEQLLKGGESYTIPRNTEHVVVNHSDVRELKALAVASPSGFAKLIAAAGIEVAAGESFPSKQHDMAVVARMLDEIGDKIITPPEKAV